MKTGTALLLAIGGLTLFCLIGLGINAMGDKPTTTTPAPAQRQTTDAFDRAAFDAHWKQFAGSSWGQTVTKVERDFYGMTAYTTLAADADAKQPALMICGTILNYFGTGSAPAVRVLDQADNVLASRHRDGAADPESSSARSSQHPPP